MIGPNSINKGAIFEVIPNKIFKDATILILSDRAQSNIYND